MKSNIDRVCLKYYISWDPELITSLHCLRRWFLTGTSCDHARWWCRINTWQAWVCSQISYCVVHSKILFNINCGQWHFSDFSFCSLEDFSIFQILWTAIVLCFILHTWWTSIVGANTSLHSSVLCAPFFFSLQETAPYYSGFKGLRVWNSPSSQSSLLGRALLSHTPNSRICLCVSSLPVVHLQPAWWPAATSPTRPTHAPSTPGSSLVTLTPCWSPRETWRPSSPSMARSWAAPCTRVTPLFSTPMRGTPVLLSPERMEGWL